MPVLSKDDFTALFVHIPKCGGSSFLARASEAGWAESFSVRGIKAQRLRHFRCTPQHFHADLLERTFDLDCFDEIVCIVRHPFERAKSEYYWQRAQGEAPAEPASWWPRMVEAYRQDPHVHDNHMRPQRDFVVNSDRLVVFKLEEDGVERALGRLRTLSGGGGVGGFFKKRPKLKKSDKENEIEAAFDAMRGRIEDFYSTDMEAFQY